MESGGAPTVVPSIVSTWAVSDPLQVVVLMTALTIASFQTSSEDRVGLLAASTKIRIVRYERFSHGLHSKPGVAQSYVDRADEAKAARDAHLHRVIAHVYEIPRSGAWRGNKGSESDR